MEYFYRRITSQNQTIKEFIDLLGKINYVDVIGNVQNIFIIPNNQLFKSIFISKDTLYDSVKTIGFVGTEEFQIPFTQCRKYATDYSTQFLIYDEKVEYIFNIYDNDILKSIVCKADENTLSYGTEQNELLAFNNIFFVFK